MRFSSHCFHYAVDFQFDRFNAFQPFVVHDFDGNSMHTGFECVRLFARFVEKFFRLKALFLIIVKIPSVKLDARLTVSFCRKFNLTVSFALLFAITFESCILEGLPETYAPFPNFPHVRLRFSQKIRIFIARFP